MAQPFVVTISHTLGKEEAVRRLKTGLADVSRMLADNKMVLVDNSWVDDKATFSVKALGQSVSGTIEVLDDVVRLEAQLPWMLAAFAQKMRAAIENRGTLLLEKK